MARKTSTLTLKAAQSLWQDEKIREVRWCGQKKTIEKLVHPISVLPFFVLSARCGLFRAF